MAWRPFSKRELSTLPQWDEPFEDVPPHLLPSLLGVINQQVTNYPELMGVVQRKLQIEFNHVQSPNAFMNYLQTPPSNALDVIDLIIAFLWERVKQGSSYYGTTASATDFANFISNVNKYFVESNTNYEVNKSGENWGLSRRFSQETTMSLKQIESRNDSTAKLLRTAWDKFLSHDSDFRGSFSFSVLALESVVCPMFIPNDGAPTLGKALSSMRQRRDMIQIKGLSPKNISSPDLLITMLQSIWETQGRHVEAGGAAPKEVIREEAESVLILTISIVHLFQRGLIEYNSEN